MSVPPNKIVVSVNYVTAITNLSRSTVRRLELAGSFPRRRQISPRRVGWILTEVLTFIENRNKA